MFSEHSYGFRPGRSAQDAMRAAQQYAQEGKDWVVDLDITKFFDHVDHDILMGRVAQVIRDKRVLHLIGKYLRRDALVDARGKGQHEGHAAGRADYGLNAKDNFEFERAVRYRQEGRK